MTPKGNDQLQELQQQNAALQKQVEELTAERDSYLRALHSWAKQKVSEEVVTNWMAGEQVEGTLVDFINEVRQGKQTH